MSQRNPLLHHTQATESASAQANGQTEPQAPMSASQQVGTATSPPVSESTPQQADVPTSKQDTKPTKSYRLHKELTFRFMLWARARHMTESEAVANAMEEYMVTYDRRRAKLAELSTLGQELEQEATP